MQQPVFIISDRSGLTAETLCHTLLTQFPDIEFRQAALPFVDSAEKMAEALEKIHQAGREYGVRPMVFATFVDENLVTALQQADIELFDLFDPFINRLERALGQRSSHEAGQAHGMTDINQYQKRISAVNYSLRCDDGLHSGDYDNATMILTGVSRSGKTPTCLYLALHFGFYVANYPLTEEDFARGELPSEMLKNRERVFGLTIDPLRLHEIRSERRPGSRYAALAQCRTEVDSALQLFHRYRIPYSDSTSYSVEELGSAIKHQMGLKSELY